MSRINLKDKARKLTNPDSEMTKLKLLWRKSWPEAEQDYWREQLSSTRTQAELRQELQDKYGIRLLYNVQFIRFGRWVEADDHRKLHAEAMECDRAELEARGLTGVSLRNELLKCMQQRALSQGDFKLGAAAVNLDLRAERVAIHHGTLALQKHKVNALEKANEVAARPGGLTPEVLRQIETDLNLM
jgi:hypothetical protein